MAFCVLLFAAVTPATAAKPRRTKVTLESSVAVDDGYYVDSGQVLSSSVRCRFFRIVKLVGIRAGGTKKLLDIALTSFGGALGNQSQARRIQASDCLG